MKPSEIITAADDYITEHGWTQHREVAADGSVCAGMALCRVKRANNLSAMNVLEAREALAHVAAELSGSQVSTIPIFNDMVCRDETDLHNWFGKARAALEEQGK